MQPTMTNSAMRNGLILGVLFTVNFLISASGVAMLGLLSYLITALIIYYTYRFTVNFRDKESEGFISFARAYWYVLLLFIFASIVSSFTKYFYLKFFGTAFLENMFNQNIAVFEQIMPSVPEKMYDTMEILTNPEMFTIMTAWTNMFLAIIFGLIIAAMVKKEKNPFDN